MSPLLLAAALWTHPAHAADPSEAPPEDAPVIDVTTAPRRIVAIRVTR